MRIGMIQPKVSYDLKENLEQIKKGIEQCALEEADLVILPELWNTPFINEEIVKHQDEGKEILDFISVMAARYHLWIFAGTIVWKEKDHVYNRCWIFNDQGEAVSYADKCHLLEVHTSHSDYFESDVFTPGDSFCQLDTPWGHVGVLVCYDMRFCEMARLLSKDSFLLVWPAGFNAKVGEKHWRSLAKTRAMENQVFVVGVNPAACSYPTYQSYGHSILVDPDGTVLLEMDEDHRAAVVEIDVNQVSKIRRRSPFWKVRREDLYLLKGKEDKEDYEEN